MPIPNDIIESVKKGQCVLFLGAMASAPTPKGSRFVYRDAPPSGSALCQRLVKIFGYQGDESTNLAHVSLYAEYGEHNSRSSLVDTLRREIAPEDATGSPMIVPSPALHMLAAMPFRIVITTNYDDLFETALSQVKALDGSLAPKRPLIKVYDPTRQGPPESVPLDPSTSQPILLKLHGDFSKRESIVITEEDYVVFIQRMSDLHLHPIHENIRARMKTWPVLFIGYSLKDYNLRLLFRTLRWGVDPANYPLCFSVDPYPDNLILSVWQGGKIVNFIRQDLWEFVPELYKDCLGEEYMP
jgi:hypothetical protein